MSGAIHAGCVLLGEKGLLIRGPSGVGKSFLAARLVAARRAQGRFAAHVADDRVRLERLGGRLVARAHPAIAGLREVRGYGIVAEGHAPACIVAGLVDIVAEPGERLPAAPAAPVLVLGVALAHLVVLADDWIVDRVETFLRHSYLR